MYHEYPYTTYFHDIDKMCNACNKAGYRLEVSGDYLKLIDEKGNVINPTEPNAYKFEAFIFDAFSSIPEMLVMRVKREEEFAPVKNAEGVDSPETARKLYMDYFAKH